MASARRGSDERVDADGVRVVRSAGSRLDTWLVVAGGLAVIWLMFRPGEIQPPPAVPPPDGPGAAVTFRPDVAPTAMGGVEDDAPGVGATSRREARRLEVYARRRARKILPRTRGPEGKPEVQAADAIAALRAAGITDGIAAFNPPGTDPPKSGVIVPEGVELPEGYLRHYQTTDEGEALPPILLFHPDYDFFDETGQPVDVPADRVVPPELVPPGIAIDDAPPAADRSARQP
jgi:hypothetical protein